VKEKFPTTFTRGSDLFDATLFKSEEATTYFYKFMGELKDSIQQSSHTLTHQFIKLLGDKGKLLRCYTQNIDDLENDLNLNTNLNDIGVQVVQMHGTLSRVVCTLSNQHNFEFDDKHIECFKEGKIPNCPSCETYEQERVKSGKRAPATGLLRPDIVLYNETHPQGEQIGSIQCNDLRKKPDLLIIMGTSLKVVGCKRLVKEMAKSIHANRKGKVIFVNLGTVSDSEWGDVIDYHFQLPTDDWVKKIMNVWGQLDRNTPKNLLMGRKSITMPTSKPSKRATLAKSKPSLSSKRQVRINVAKAIKSKPKSPKLVQSPLKFPSVKKNTDNVLKKTPAFKEFNSKLSNISSFYLL
jgi:NAD-dependent histone deacetylase SIR2